MASGIRYSSTLIDGLRSLAAKVARYRKGERPAITAGEAGVVEDAAALIERVKRLSRHRHQQSRTRANAKRLSR